MEKAKIYDSGGHIEIWPDIDPYTKESLFIKGQNFKSLKIEEDVLTLYDFNDIEIDSFTIIN